MTKPKGQHIRVSEGESEKQQQMDAVRDRRKTMLQQFRTGYGRTSSTQANKGDSNSECTEVEFDDE